MFSSQNGVGISSRREGEGGSTGYGQASSSVLENEARGAEPASHKRIPESLLRWNTVVLVCYSAMDKGWRDPFTHCNEIALHIHMVHRTQRWEARPLLKCISAKGRLSLMRRQGTERFKQNVNNGISQYLTKSPGLRLFKFSSILQINTIPEFK